MSSALPQTLWHHGLFGGGRLCPVVSEVGDTWIAMCGKTPNVVRKSEVDAKRSDDIGWWSSPERWADQVVTDAEAWAATIQERLDSIDAEIAALRAERARDVAEALAATERARAWRRQFAESEPSA